MFCYLTRCAIINAKICKRGFDMTKNDFSKIQTPNVREILPEAVDAIFDTISQKDIELKAVENMAAEFLCSHRENTDLETVIQKIRLLDYINTTNLRMYRDDITITALAEIILAQPAFDKWLQNGDIRAVELIARGNNTINLFSFATKYCCYHNYYVYHRDDFSIYDTVVKDTIPKYINVTKTYIEDLRKNYQYREFLDLIDRLMTEYNINCESRRKKLDLFLWYYNR